MLIWKKTITKDDIYETNWDINMKGYWKYFPFLGRVMEFRSHNFMPVIF